MTETEYLKMYIDELAEIKPCTEQERSDLLAKLGTGDEEAMNRLIEGHLRLVPEIVTEYEGSGAPVSDMVQEGNMALMAAVSVCRCGTPAGDFEEYLSKLIRKGLEDFIQMEGAETLAAGKLETETNRLLNLTKDFEDENERPATLAELSERMGLPEDQVENLIRVSASAMSLGDKGEEPAAKAPAKNPLKDGWG